MKIDTNNIKDVDLKNHLHFKIVIVGTSNRKGSGRDNCSGYNINKNIFNGMSVDEYQNMIIENFSKNDPQYSLTKHLKYDIEKGFIELHGI